MIFLNHEPVGEALSDSITNLFNPDSEYEFPKHNDMIELCASALWNRKLFLLEHGNNKILYNILATISNAFDNITPWCIMVLNELRFTFDKMIHYHQAFSIVIV